jgi:hypothetical protein
LEGQINPFTEEIGANLTSTFGRGPQHAVVQLRKIQLELASEIESQTEVVAKVSLERQKLQSLLDDNPMKWCQELLLFNVYSVSNY